MKNFILEKSKRIFSVKNYLLLFFVLPILVVQLPLFASDGEKIGAEKTPLRIPRIESEIKIDGYLNEEAWSRAAQIDANIEVEPGENIPAPVKTEVFIAYDNSNIYVAFKASDPNPSQIRANLCGRDNIWDDDWVLILFDTFNDERRCYDFGCNPLGIQADIIESVSGGGDSWDAIWESDGRITEEGYIVEMAIPFSSLKFPRSEGDQTWGFDAVRSYPRKVRHHIGAFPRDRSNNCYFCQLEKLVGFSDVVPGRDIEFAPTFTSVAAQERENETSGPFDEKHSNDLGLTSSWGLTNNLRLCATLNPDFSTIEADVIQLDINKRFELWYPEKRPFFLEGADFFETMIDVVHTRTLADPNFGVKLTGKEGKNTIGLFSTQDAVRSFVIPSLDGSDSDVLDMKSYGTIFRYLRDFGQSSNIGLLLTDREGENYHNRVLGLDGIINFTKKDQLRWQVLGTKTLYPDEISSGYGQPTDEFGGNCIAANYSHSISKYNFYGVYQEMSPDFRTDLGSVTQTGYRYGEAGGNYIWRAGPGHWFTWINIYSGAAFGKDYYGNTAHKSLRGNLNYNGPLQSYCGVYGQVSRDIYHETEFKTSYLNYWVGGKPTKWFNFNFWSVFGDQVDFDNTRQGKGLQLGLWTNLNIGRHISVCLDLYYDRMNVNDSRLYTAYREYIKLMYHFNGKVFIRTIFQYAIYKKDPALYYDVVEPREQEFLTQILFSYQVNPNTAFYIGYSDNYYGDNDTDIIQTDRSLFAKIGYAWMF